MVNIIDINLLHVSTPVCHLQGVFRIKGINVQHTNVGMRRTHCNDSLLITYLLTYWLACLFTYLLNYYLLTHSLT